MTLGLLLTPFATSSVAQAAAPAGSGAASQRVLLPGVLPPALAHATLTGKDDASRPLHLTVSLALANPAALQARAKGVNVKGSAQYHKFMTPAEFTSTFAPAVDHVTKVRDFLQQQGLTVTSQSADRLLLNVTGTEAQVEKAFDTTLGTFTLGKSTYFAPERVPSVPASLKGFILSVSGMDNLAVAKPKLLPYGDVPLGIFPRQLNNEQRASSASTASASGATSTTTLADTAQPAPGVTTSPSATPSPTPTVPTKRPAGVRAPAGTQVIYPTPSLPGYSPTDLRGAYDVASLLSASGVNGAAGQHIAVYELAPYIYNDIAAYRTQYALGTASIVDHSVNGGAVEGDAPGTSEADLDIEVISALAPNATQDVYTGNNPYDVISTYDAIVTDNVDKVISTSWGLCEAFSGKSDLQSLDTIFQKASAQGQTIFDAAGDIGSDDCGYAAYGLPPSVDSPAGDPYVVAVGGTSLSVTNAGQSNASYGSETVWNGDCQSACGGGGGVSQTFALQPWEIGKGVVSGLSTGTREVPDVSANADPGSGKGYQTYCSSYYDCSTSSGVGYGFIPIGGTSAAAPLWAGILTDVNAYLAANSKPAAGWVNATLYQLFAYAQTYAPYKDVTSGNNDIDYSGSPFAGDYSASTCYDMASGMGSPDAWNIARDLAGGVQTSTGSACAQPASAVTNLVSDGGFETQGAGGTVSWQTFSSGGYPVIGKFSAYDGSYDFGACGYLTCDDRVWQTVPVPATVHTASLRFWIEGYTSMRTALGSTPEPCVDHFYATLATVDGTVVDTAETDCQLFTYGGYAIESFDVTSALQAHTSSSLVLTLRGTTGGESAYGIPSYWYVDDVALNVS